MIPKLPKGFTHPMAIGEGAFSSVYRVRQTALDRWVAIKIFKERDPKRRKGLLSEAKVQARMQVAGIPSVFDAFECAGQVCIVMQWIKGVPLDDLLAQEPLAEERVSLAEGLIRTVAGLHNLDYAHRDLKPANILVTPDDGVYLVDFGFSRNIQSLWQSVAGKVRGTPAYMAPELWLGRDSVDLRRSDLYALGKILTHVLHGHPLVTLTAGLLEEEPTKRPASGMAFLEQWTQRQPAPGETVNLRRLVSPICGESLSRNLLTASRQLIAAGRNEEAYWLLVECLENNPESPEALDLISTFPAFSRSRKRHQRAFVVGTSASLLLALCLAFWFGRQSRDWEEDRLRRIPDETRENKVWLRLPEPGSMAFKRIGQADMTTVSALSGRLRLEGLPEKGELRVNGLPVPVETAVKGMILRAGRQEIAWSDTTGAVQWRELVTLLPFQVKVLGMDFRKESEN